MSKRTLEDTLAVPDDLPVEFKLSRSRIMYLEAKGGTNDLEGEARICRVYFSKSGKSLYYRGLILRSLKGKGFKANYFDVETGVHYWVSGPHKDRNDRLYGGNDGVVIDSDVADEYQQMITLR